MEKVYASIDLKSFYASVECVERGLNPLTTNLVVADCSKTEKTICLAVSPSLKSYGIPGRARLFEVIQKVKNVNSQRKVKICNHTFKGKSCDDIKLKKDITLELDYIIASPRMRYYMKYSTTIYNIYLKYIAPEDIFPYSIDEVFCDITKYLKLYNLTAKQLVTKMIMDVYKTTGIIATAGIGTNMFLCKVAMDIGAKHINPDKYGVRIAELDEMSFREKLWNHRPITDFWRVGKGYAKRLKENNMYTMGDIARCSVNNEELLYKLFGVNAELLIDHSWGWECTTIESIKKYKPQAKSLSSGQVLHCPYNFEKARLIIKEMVELLVLDMVEKQYVTDQLVLDIIYDIENLTNKNYSEFYNGDITIDHYGRNTPKPAHGTLRLEKKTSSTKIITNGFLKLYDEIVNNKLLIRKVNMCVGNLINELDIKEQNKYEQVNLFTNYKELEKQKEKENKELQNEKKLQKTIIDIKNKYGKNAILKGMNLEKGATTIERNRQIGGHQGGIV
ncbi:MAG: DNA methylase [Clostridia bacterium]|nr:DNA methylase [Clostridia bacterium]